MKKPNLKAPWYTYQNKLKALFERDPDIIVGDIYEMGDGEFDYALDIEVRNHEKYEALDRTLKVDLEFGNVTLGISLYDAVNSEPADAGIELFSTIFRGNPIVKDIKDIKDFTGTEHCFIEFQPEVIQFYNDDIADYNGNWSGLAQDIAREVFGDEVRGVHFCTAAVDETGTNGQGV